MARCPRSAADDPLAAALRHREAGGAGRHGRRNCGGCRARIFPLRAGNLVGIDALAAVCFGRGDDADPSMLPTLCSMQPSHRLARWSTRSSGPAKV